MDIEKLIIFTGRSFEEGTDKLSNFISNIEPNKGELLYFPINRVITIKKEDIDRDNDEIINKLSKRLSIKDRLETCYDLHDPFRYESWQHGGKIDCGYVQVMNLMYNLYFRRDKKLIVVIDHFERNLHVLLARALINDMCSFTNIDKLVVSCYSQYLLSEFKHNVVKEVMI